MMRVLVESETRYYLAMLFPRILATFALMVTGLVNASRPNWTGLEVHNFAQSAQDPSVIYASTSPLGVFKSSDHGLSWQSMKLPRLISDSAVVVHPEQLGHLFVLTRGRSGGYYESLDAGKTWRWQTLLPVTKKFDRSDPITPVDFLAVDPAKYGGAWWARLSDSLFRSVDQGKSWQLNAQGSGPIHHTDDASFRFSGNTLFHSKDRGNSWSEIYRFNPSEHRNQLRQFTPLSNGLLMIRHEGLWRQSSDGGKSWEVASNGFEQLPDHQQLSASKSGPFGGLWNTSCRLDVSPVSPADLLARCVSGNGSLPSSVCLKRSDDWGRHWVDVGNDCKATGLPPYWSPSAFLWDRADKNTLWLAWPGGGIYRTTDGGRLWADADEGLLFFNAKEESFASYLSLVEPPLHRAVFHRDLPTIQRLIAEGADINADGNYIGSVLAVDLQATQLEQRESIPYRSMYFELRQLGALPRLVKSPESRLLEQAVLLHRIDIVEDLVNNGYDWSLLKLDLFDENKYSELANLQSGLQQLGKPMSYWIDAYIRAAVFPSADQTVMDLFDRGEPNLALKVLTAASRSVPFDRQTGAASSVRLKIIAELLAVKKNAWARRVYQVTPQPHTKAGLDALSTALSDHCDFTLLQAVDDPDANMACILGLPSILSQRQKQHLWKKLDERGQLTQKRWIWVMNKLPASWIFQTPAYRRNADVLEPLRGVLDIELIRSKNQLFVESVKVNSPAMRAGVKAGDQIVEIGGVAVTEIAPDNVGTTIRGRPGTSVHLKLQRAKKTFSVNVKRRPLDAR
jgi:photosystem II stability/assembly factor-like uncharacterized protein